MKNVSLSATEVAIVKNVVAIAIKSVKSDLRGADIITKKLVDNSLVALESIQEHVSVKFTVTPQEVEILNVLLNVTIGNLKSDSRGANTTTKRILAEQIAGLEALGAQLSADDELVVVPEPEHIPAQEVKNTKQVLAANKRPRKSKKVSELIDNLD